MVETRLVARLLWREGRCCAPVTWSLAILLVEGGRKPFLCGEEKGGRKKGTIMLQGAGRGGSGTGGDRAGVI